MSYPEIFRKRVVEYRKENNTLEETSKILKEQFQQLVIGNKN